MSIHKGACHCGRVRFEADVEFTRVTTCNCSICDQKGAVYAPAQKNHLNITQGEDDLTLYEFGTKTAKHYFCKHCGIHPFLKPRIAPTRWVVNLRCLEGIDVQDLQPEMFDGQNWEESAQAWLARK